MNEQVIHLDRFIAGLEKSHQVDQLLDGQIAVELGHGRVRTFQLLLIRVGEDVGRVDYGGDEIAIGTNAGDFTAQRHGDGRL